MLTTAKKLRFDTKEVLNSVSRGEEVIITYRGKAYAKLVPLHKSSKRRNKESELFGIWKDNKTVRDVNHFVRLLRRRRKNVTD